MLTRSTPLTPGCREVLCALVAECVECGALVTACADSDLTEPELRALAVEARCELDCASLCRDIGGSMAAQDSPDLQLIYGAIAFCSAACVLCAEECDRHAARDEQCSTCSEARRRCRAAAGQVARLFA